MQVDEDVPEFVDYKQSDLLKLIRIYEQTFKDCDPDRPIMTRLNVTLVKNDVDQLLLEDEYQTTCEVVAFYLNYIINYCLMVKKQPPYFIVVSTQMENPTLENIMLFEGKINQSTFGQFKYKPTSHQIIMLVNCQKKWFMIFLDLLNWIIDYKYDKFTNLQQIQTFVSQFFEQNLSLQVDDLHDYMIEASQPGDCGDLICYTIYKIFVAAQKLNDDDILTKQEITLSKKRLLWLILKLMKSRTKEEDDVEFQKRVLKKQLQDSQKQVEENQKNQAEIKGEIEKTKQKVYKFINQEPPAQKLEQKQVLFAGQFNATRPIGKVESFLTKQKVTLDYGIPFPKPSDEGKPQKVVKDERAKVKTVKYQYQQSYRPKINLITGELIPDQLITPASYCIADMFNNNYSVVEPKYRRVYDYKIMEENMRAKEDFAQQLQPSQNPGFFGKIGSRIFDHADYTPGVVFQPKPKEKVERRRMPTSLEQIDWLIRQKEQELLQP